MADKEKKQMFYSVLELSRVLDVTAVTIRRRIKAARLEDARGMGKYLLTGDEVAEIFGDRFSKAEITARIGRIKVNGVMAAG